MHLRSISENIYIPLDDKLFIDGMERPFVIDGTLYGLAPEVIVNLLEFLNKKDENPIASLTAEVSVAGLQRLMDDLMQLGVVYEDYGLPGARRGHANQTSLAIRRFSRSSAINGNPAKLIEQLERARICILVDENNDNGGQVLATLLHKSGIRCAILAQRADSELLLHHQRDITDATLVIALNNKSDRSAWFRQIGQICSKAGTPWLRLEIDGSRGYGDIGPLFEPPRTPCFDCFDEMHGNVAIQPKVASSNVAIEEMFFGLAAMEILLLILRKKEIIIKKTFRRYFIENWKFYDVRLARSCICVTCRPSQNNLGSQKIRSTSTALVYEEFVGASTASVEQNANRRKASGIQAVLRGTTKRLPHSPQHSLPPIPLEYFSSVSFQNRSQDGLLGRVELGIMLALVSGIRTPSVGKNPRRWMATAGDLGSVEIYVLIRHIDGLLPGLYFYQTDDHSLAHFEKKHEEQRTDEIAGKLCDHFNGLIPPAVIIFTGSYQRLVSKYREFAYKLLNLDAGAAMCQLHAVAKTLNLFTKSHLLFDDGFIEELLNLVPFQEEVTGCISVWPENCQERLIQKEQKAILKVGNPAVAANRVLMKEFHEITPLEVTERLYRESRWTGSEEVDADSTFNNSRLEHLELATLAKSSGAFSAKVFQRRHSVRKFSLDSVEEHQIKAAIKSASNEDERYSLNDSDRDSLKFIVLARMTTGIRRGVYVYDRRKETLCEERSHLADEEIKKLFVQPGLSEAAFSIWLIGDLSATDSKSAHQHRRLLVRAGAAGYHLWLWAINNGLCGTMAAGLLIDQSRLILNLDGYRRIPLVAFVGGFA